MLRLLDSRNQIFLSETHFSELINVGLWADRNKRKNTSSASSADEDSTIDVGQGRF